MKCIILFSTDRVTEKKNTILDEKGTCCDVPKQQQEIFFFLFFFKKNHVFPQLLYRIHHHHLLLKTERSKARGHLKSLKLIQLETFQLACFPLTLNGTDCTKALTNRVQWHDFPLPLIKLCFCLFSRYYYHTFTSCTFPSYFRLPFK